MQYNSKWIKSESLCENTKSDSPSKYTISLFPRIIGVEKEIRNQMIDIERVLNDLRFKDTELFDKFVISVKENNTQYTSLLSAELLSSRRLSKSLCLVYLLLEGIKSKMKTIHNFADVVFVISTSVSIIKNARTLLAWQISDFTAGLSEVSDAMGSILIDASQIGGYTINFKTANDEASRIINESLILAEQKLKEILPEMPEISAKSVEK